MSSCVKMEKWNYCRTGGKGDKWEWWREWIQLWYIVRTLLNVTVYPQYNNNNKKGTNKYWMFFLWKKNVFSMFARFLNQSKTYNPKQKESNWNRDDWVAHSTEVLRKWWGWGGKSLGNSVSAFPTQRQVAAHTPAPPVTEAVIIHCPLLHLPSSQKATVGPPNTITDQRPDGPVFLFLFFENEE
jgi:hypothetical protein